MATRESYSEKAQPKRITPYRNHTEKIMQSATEKKQQLAVSLHAARSSLARQPISIHQAATAGYKRSVQSKKGYSGSARARGKMSMLVLYRAKSAGNTLLELFVNAEGLQSNSVCVCFGGDKPEQLPKGYSTGVTE